MQGNNKTVRYEVIDICRGQPVEFLKDSPIVAPVQEIYRECHSIYEGCSLIRDQLRGKNKRG